MAIGPISRGAKGRRLPDAGIDSTTFEVYYS